MMDDFDILMAEQMKNPEFIAEWEALQPGFATIQTEIDPQKKAVIGPDR